MNEGANGARCCEGIGDDVVEKLLRHEPSILYEGVKGRSPTRVRQEVASILRVGTEGSLPNLVRRFKLGPPLVTIAV